MAGWGLDSVRAERTQMQSFGRLAEDGEGDHTFAFPLHILFVLSAVLVPPFRWPGRSPRGCALTAGVQGALLTRHWIIDLSWFPASSSSARWHAQHRMIPPLMLVLLLVGLRGRYCWVGRANRGA